MPLLNTADTVYVGGTEAVKVYQGAVESWSGGGGPPEPATPTVRGTSALATGSVTSGSISYPAGIESGDRGFMAAIYNSSLGTPTTPTGWVLESTHTVTGTTENRLYSRVMDGTETGSLSLAWPGTVQKMAWSMWVGGNVGDLSATAWGAKGLTTDGSISVPVATPAATDHVLVTFLTERSSSPSSSFTVPAGTTAGAAQFGSGGGSSCAGCAYNLTLDADGSVGSGTWAWSSGGTVNVGALTLAVAVGAPAVDPQIVWTEDWEGWATGSMTTTFPVTILDGTPTIESSGIDGQSAQVGPSGNGFHVNVASLSHWSLEFTAKMSGTISANHYIVSARASGDVYIGDLSMRLSGNQIWNRIDFGADALGRSTWTYTNPSTVRIIYEWYDDEYLKVFLFYGANLNGTTPDETLLYDKTMVSGKLVGKRCATLRFGNNATDGITSQFDNLILRDLTL